MHQFLEQPTEHTHQNLWRHCAFDLEGLRQRIHARGADLETTYRVMRTYHMLKGKPAREKDLRAFVATCRNKDGGYGVVPGVPSAAGSTYFASIVLHWLDSK